MESVDKLKEKIKRLEELAVLRQEWEKHITPLIQITSKEKCDRFDELYWQARNIVSDLAESGYLDDDDPHYLYEAVMTKLLGKDIFSMINKLHD
jgi:hypothetical protein